VLQDVLPNRRFTKSQKCSLNMWCIVGCYGQLIMLKFVLDMAESKLPNKL
jgi:hypothetical protein